MRRVCLYHAGCPDGFGAAWAVWRAWGDAGEYRALGHEDDVPAAAFEDAVVAFVDIAPPNQTLRELGAVADQVIVLDHHLSALERFQSDLALENVLRDQGHHVEFDLGHSGAVLAWSHFHPRVDVPELLLYVEDQDLWSWKLPRSEQVNAVLASHPRRFEIWDELAARPISELAREGEPLLRSNAVELERILQSAHPVSVDGGRVEAVNAIRNRSSIGHALAQRAAFGLPVGLCYRIQGQRVDASVYSIGDFDVSRLAAHYGGGGHRNAAGFSVPLRRWLEEFL